MEEKIFKMSLLDCDAERTYNCTVVRVWCVKQRSRLEKRRKGSVCGEDMLILRIKVN